MKAAQEDQYVFTAGESLQGAIPEAHDTRKHLTAPEKLFTEDNKRSLGRASPTCSTAGSGTATTRASVLGEWNKHYGSNATEQEDHDRQGW